MKKPLDILIICPLAQEMEVLTRLLFSDLGNTQDAAQSFDEQKAKLPTLNSCGHPPLYASLINNLMVGVIQIGSAGNTHAAIKCGPILAAMRPKVVFLTGIAGGRHPTVSLGDVVYNNSIVYSSFAKIAGREPIRAEQDTLLRQVEANSELVPEEKDAVKKIIELGIRIKLRAPRLGDQPGPANNIARHYADFIRRASDNSARADRWQQVARTLFDKLTVQARDGANLWLRDGHVWAPGGQDPKCHCVNVASGEAVIASGTFQAALKHAVSKEYGDSSTVDAFEMEAYAVNYLCNVHNIYFLTIRGISDPATEFKDTPDKGSASVANEELFSAQTGGEKIVKDSHHLSAVCGAAAFARAILINDDFQRDVQNLETPSALSSAVPCADKETRSWCLHRPAQKCLDLGISPNELRRIGIGYEQPIMRVYEGVDEREFSHLLTRTFDEYLKQKISARVLLLFPYSANEIARLLGYKDKQSFSKTAEENLDKLQGRVLRDFSHFEKIEEYARWLFANEQGVADRRVGVTRIVLTNNRGLLPASDKPIYSALLGTRHLDGTKIETLQASSLSMLKDGFVADDVVMMQSVEEEESWLRALRYYPRSRLLVVRGWHCRAALWQHETSVEDPLDQLWNRWFDGHLMFQQCDLV